MVPVPLKVFEQALQSASLELKYENSAHLVDIISKDEDLRRLRFDINILEDDNDELRGLLAQETERSDAFEKLVNNNLGRAEYAEAQLQALDANLREREQQVSTLQAECDALQYKSEDVSAALAEKLALTRELSMLKPELEHLKLQAASSEALMADKLALQRQLTESQCEVENARREAKRALAKRRNTGIEIAQEEQVEDLKRQLAKEKRARQRAEEATNMSQSDAGADDVRKELAREKKARQRAEEKLEEAQNATQIEDVRKDLLKEKRTKQKLEDAVENLQTELEAERRAVARAAKKAEGSAEVGGQVEELREELEAERVERAKAVKAAQKVATEFAVQKEVLEDKLNQFRTKLRSTKETLKETQAELQSARDAAEAAPVQKAPGPKKSNKRNTVEMDHESTNLGTPGDGPTAKRMRKTAGIGDKSMFSMTPFLNKTMTVLAESEDEKSEVEVSPVAKKQPLAEQPASKANVQTKARKPASKPSLEMVTEEVEDAFSQGQENEAAVKQPTAKVKTKTNDGADKPTGAQKRRVRKSIHDFASFNADPEVKKKKRKLGGAGRTLFDEEEEAAPVRALPARGLFGTKSFGLGVKKGGLLGALKPATTLLTAGDGSGFQFSPLKRSRKNLDDTLRG